MNALERDFLKLKAPEIQLSIKIAAMPQRMRNSLGGNGEGKVKIQVKSLRGKKLNPVLKK